MKKIAFLGLGVMGFPMAGHLAKAGYEVTVYNRTKTKADHWVTTYQGKSADTPSEAAKGQDIVFSCVGNDKDLIEITLGDNGAFKAMNKGAIFVDHTTASAEVARKLYEEAQKCELNFIDAPVSGGQAGAENGKLTVMCGGDQAIYEKIEKAIDSYAVSVRLMGPAGSGQLCKMVNQICLAGIVQGLSEGLQFGVNAGLDMKSVIEVLSKGAAGSWQMENRGNTMVDNKFDFGFAVDLMRKDLGICLNEARNNGSTLPITALIDQFYADIQRAGNNRFDTSSLITRLRD
ncbi:MULTISPECIES: NAD(P)-dependent oxidoreductase [unclassified Bartonella]|uniref:NAD(P)-dependent oxidoreductase n=1 Tax=unclassified Bartonella TaxID=2645622 RepID=UPI0021C9EB98|nr:MULTISPECIES: NAD(P)-dependent oxidoreductase [unclassified Bartonella]UXN03969.1 NAD(P)-dependent oxidoreductase [Bartonella sp. HY406]UXN06952.1 NAD(P)-dependent oxidoreductase [Bartonella sp. HY761]